jgi:hypothetical protein
MTAGHLLFQLTLGKIIPVPLKYLIFTMQNSSCWTPHGSSARKVAILLAIGDREFTFGELSMKAG